jgi:hypothetical protein
LNRKQHLGVAGSIGLGILLSAGLPGLAMAAGPKPADPPTTVNITGTVKTLGGVGIVGITVIGDGASDTTGAGGAYSLTVPASVNNNVRFEDHANKYLSGVYDTTAPNNLKISVGSTGTPVVVGLVDVPGIDVKMTVGLHIKGTIKGPAVPPNPLQGIYVNALGSGYEATTTTAANGTYSLTVPAGTFNLTIYSWQGLYDGGCSRFSITPATPECQVVVGATDVTGVNEAMTVAGMALLVITPAAGTVRTGYGQPFTATLEADNPQAIPHKGGGIDISNVTAFTTFSIDPAGSCTGRTCTPPVDGPYTVSGTYSTASGDTTLQAAIDGPIPPLPPITSVESPAPVGGAPNFAILLFGFAAAALTLITFRRRVQFRQ